MAIARLNVRVGKKGVGAAHVQYIARSGMYESKRESSPEELEALRAGNLPAWADDDPVKFWDAADAYERKNGTTYREMVIALPRELTPEQRLALVEEWVEQEIGDTHAYCWAIHNPKAADGGDQPHVHLMFSEQRRKEAKVVDPDPDIYFRRPEVGGCKKGYGERPGDKLTKAERNAELIRLRDRWEVMCNSHLERAGRGERISMRSYKDQGIKKTPEKKLPPSGKGMEKVLEFRKAREAARAARREAAKELASDLAALPSGRKQDPLERMPLNKLRAWVEANQPRSIEERVTQDARVLEAREAYYKADDDFRVAVADRHKLAREIEAAQGGSEKQQLRMERLDGLIERRKEGLAAAREQLQKTAESVRAQAVEDDRSGRTKAREMRYHKGREILEQRDVVRGNVQVVVDRVSELARAKLIRGEDHAPVEAREHVDRMIKAQDSGREGERAFRAVLRKELAADPSAAAELRKVLERAAGRDSGGSEIQTPSRGGQAGPDDPRGAGGRPNPAPGAQEPAGVTIGKDQPGNKGAKDRSGGKSGKELPVTPQPSKTPKKIEQEKPKPKPKSNDKDKDKDKGLDWEI